MPENSTINFLSYDEMEKSIEEMSKELEKIEVFGAKKAYDMIRARSYKSDFWRWMTLWSKGGVYIDAKYGFEIPVEKWVSFENDEFIMCPCLRATMNTPLIVATQYHPIALFMVQDMIKNSNERLYYSSDLDTTGPGAVRKLVNATGMATHYNLRCWMKHNMKMDLYMAESDTSMIGEEEKQYLIVKENPYHQDIHAMMNKCTTCNSYH
jgi:mannosyltransferase OCH1-like enzyme